MDLKNAVAVCLISMFSATMVLLIARALDLQAASRLEPQLARIVDELEAIRKQGGIAATPPAMRAEDLLSNGLIVYYFHSNVRCATCRAIESQSHETVQTLFASELTDGRMVWKELNYEQPSGSELGRQFEVQVPVVVLARMKEGQLAKWKRLDRVWALVNDETAFADYLEGEIRAMLAIEASGTASVEDASEIPVPEADSSDLPIPDDTSTIPIPE